MTVIQSMLRSKRPPGGRRRLWWDDAACRHCHPSLFSSHLGWGVAGAALAILGNQAVARGDSLDWIPNRARGGLLRWALAPRRTLTRPDAGRVGQGRLLEVPPSHLRVHLGGGQVDVTRQALDLGQGGRQG